VLICIKIGSITQYKNNGLVKPFFVFLSRFFYDKNDDG